MFRCGNWSSYFTKTNRGIGEKIIKITFIKIIFIIWEVSYLYFVLPEFDEELYVLNNQGLPRFKASLDYIF